MGLTRKLLVFVVISAFPSIAFANVIGGLLDYGFLETYLVALTTFTLTDPFGWFALVVLYSPAVLTFISLAVWGRSVFEDAKG